MDQKRLALYAELEHQVTNTTLVQYEGDVPNGNVIWIKQEMDQPFGSHYDRVFLDLFKKYEEQGDISPGDKVLETTSGSAGVSFAGLGAALGYECIVAIPEGGEKARENAIRQHLKDDNLIYTPEKDYVNGFTRFLKRYLVRNKDVFFINHSMGGIDRENGGYLNNEVTLKALSRIADEVLAATPIDHFVSAVGNGSNTLGIGRPMKEAGVKVTAFETFQSAVTYEGLYPGKYKTEFGMKPGTLPRHKLPGTSFNGIPFPHINGMFNENILDDVVLVSDQDMDLDYRSFHIDTNMDMMDCFRQDRRQKKLVHWDTSLQCTEDFGRSTKAGIAVALDLAQRVQDQAVLVIGYDRANRYDIALAA